MERVWKATVRAGLRHQSLNDLHDYLDVHRNLKNYLHALRADVLGGNYRPDPPEVVLHEKRDGISRRLMLPSPGDAILLQTIVETLEPAIKSHQPSENSYYSRSHDHPRVEAIEGTFGYPWSKLWPKYQQRVWGFSDLHPFLVITDVANYFDCIPLPALRNTLASMGAFQEDVLNFLFFMLESFTWRPYYMPHSGVGLPQVDFDAPRLLAHAYLFRADSELQHLTHGDFVRWMDDINCGVDSDAAARALLGKLEEVLNSLGLRLNAAKTKILSGRDAAKHFWITENAAITVVGNLIANNPDNETLTRNVRKILRRRFRAFGKLGNSGQRDKVYKRYLNLFGKLRDSVLQPRVPKLLEREPALRGTCCRYYSSLGFSNSRLDHLESFLTSGVCVDDATPFAIVRTLVSWNPPTQEDLRRRFVRLAREGFLRDERTTIAGLTCSLWLLAKYGDSDELLEFVCENERIWKRSHWVARQVAAIVPRLDDNARVIVTRSLASSGVIEGLRVMWSLNSIRELHYLDDQLFYYLLHQPLPGQPYPLSKILLVLWLLGGELPVNTKRDLGVEIVKIVSDRSYLRLIRAAVKAVSITL